MPRAMVILCIEDDAAQRHMLTKRFEEEGFITLEASGGEEGLNTALSKHPDIILLDNSMPGMTGFSMLTRLRTRDSWAARVPVVFLSNLEPRTREEKQDLAVISPAAYLVKSETSLDKIVETVRNVLAERG